MFNLAQRFGFYQGSIGTDTELPDIFPFPMAQGHFVDADVINIYERILTDTLERTEGIPDDRQSLLWDNCLASETTDGLVTLLAKAMATKSDLFVVYDKALALIRKATPSEQTQIKLDYATANKSKTGVYITFTKYRRTDFVKLYSALEYCTVASLHKSMNLSKAVQLKMDQMRAAIGALDSEQAVTQAKAIATALSKGRDVMLDAKDDIVTAKPDLTAAQSSMEFIAQKQSFYLGLPASWVMGDSSKGMSDTGKADTKAVERGLRGYFFAIVKPVCEALFDIKVSFKSEDFELLTSATQLLTTFEATSDELIGQDNKRKIINKMFNLPADAKGDAPVKPLQLNGTTPTAQPGKPVAVS